jgi:hypothetical protein
MEQQIFSCPNTLSVLPRSSVLFLDAPSVLIAVATDRLRSAPVTLLDQGGGAALRERRHPAPGSSNPRKSSVPHQGPSGPRRQGSRARGTPISPSAPDRPLPECGFTDRWLGALAALANPRLARWQGRLGHRLSSVAWWRGCAGAQSDLVARGQPRTWVVRASPNTRRRPDSPRSRCHRAGCSNRPERVCGRRS